MLLLQVERPEQASSGILHIGMPGAKSLFQDWDCLTKYCFSFSDDHVATGPFGVIGMAFIVERLKKINH